MGLALAATMNFLLHLLLIMCIHGSQEGMSMNSNNVLGLKSMDDKEPHHGSHMHHHMDISLMVFFYMSDLRVGNELTIYFPKKDPSNSPHLLPREEANSIPFSLDQFPYLLKFFSFSRDSQQAKIMEETLKQCLLVRPIEGETKFCANSLESMLDFVHEIPGLDSQFKVLSTTHFTKSTTLLDNYTIIDAPKEIYAPTMVACHTMPYPYTIFYCHSTKSANKVFMVSLKGDKGDLVEALAVCHLDTSRWSPDHVSFRVLGIKPGSSHVCHFFPEDNLVYVPTMPTRIGQVV